MPDNENDNVPIEDDWTGDVQQQILQDPVQLDQVSEMDKFKLAKSILVASLFLFVGIILLFAFSIQLCINEPMKEIWSFSSQGLFGIINLIIGFYFGGKIAVNKT